MKYNLFLILALAVFTIVSCSKMDDYKDKFIPTGGEISYTGKLDSLEVKSGRNRVMVTGLFASDSKITSAHIYWDSRADSLLVPVTRSTGVDTLNQIIGGLAEGAHTFEVVTFDAAGNHSVSVIASGTVYGSRYESGLINRPIASGVLDKNGNAVLTWGDFDASSGARGTQVSYTNSNGDMVNQLVPIAESVTTLPDYQSGSLLSFSTFYLPDSTSIDTFYATASQAGVKTEITSQYIKNAGPNFANSDGGNDRWQVPADWTVTDDVKNGGGDLGGLDNGGWLPSKALSIEAWWGMPAVPNGKIYQTFTLPAGKYSFEAEAGDCSDGGIKYMTVAAAGSLPDVGDVPAQALAYANVSRFANNVITFELAAETQVSLGIQANMPAEGNFMKIFSVHLFQLP